MTYKTRLQVSKLILTTMLGLFVLAHVYVIYDLTVASEGHLLETTENSIRAEFSLRETVLRIFILTPLFVVLWSNLFPERSGIYLVGCTVSLVFLSPWISSLLAIALHLPSGELSTTLSWWTVAWLAMILLAIGISFERNKN